MVRISRENTGRVWVGVDGGWKHGEHFIQRKASKFVVTAGQFKGLVFATLCDGQQTIHQLEVNAKALKEELAARDHGQDWDGYAEWLGERQAAEREGYEHGMNEYYENFVKDSQD